MREQGLKAKTQTIAPNQIWMGDITYIAIEEGWIYLAVILDLFSRKVIGLCIENRMQTDRKSVV